MSTTAEEIEKTKTSEDKKNELLLDSLEIKGYRCFEHLTIEKLGRVNLIVGKNNVGKTALLEALWIWAECSDWNDVFPVLHQILKGRKEIEKISDSGLKLSEYRHLFYSRPSSETFEKLNEILIIGENKIVSAAYDYSITKKFNSSVQTENYSDFWTRISPKPHFSKIYPFGIHYFHDFDNTVVQQPAYLSKSSIHIFHEPLNVKLISTKGLSENELNEMWDEVVWKNKERNVIEALSIISNKILNLNFTKYPKNSDGRIPVVHIDGVNEKVPLQSAGEGMNRLLGLILTIIESENGILLIDEIEIGFHYSILPDVWKLIFKTAKDLNVQVFATTHSYDCIQAFATAAIEDEESEGNLIRLARNGNEIKAFTFDERQLKTITKEHIEVR